jgi:hypothetical protein
MEDACPTRAAVHPVDRAIHTVAGGVNGSIVPRRVSYVNVPKYSGAVVNSDLVGATCSGIHAMQKLVEVATPGRVMFFICCVNLKVKDEVVVVA